MSDTVVMPDDFRGRFLRVLDRAVEFGDLSRDEALAILEAYDRGASVFTLNQRILQHEAATPMGGHDEDGSCCLRARLAP